MFCAFREVGNAKVREITLSDTLEAAYLLPISDMHIGDANISQAIPTL